MPRRWLTFVRTTPEGRLVRWISALITAPFLLAALLGGAEPVATAAQACTPAVLTQSVVLRAEQGRTSGLRVTLRPATSARPTNQLRQFRVVRTDNATVEINGVQQAVPSTYVLAATPSAFTFDLHRIAANQPFQAFFVVTDSCGDFSSFVGSGASGGDLPPATPTVAPAPIGPQPTVPATPTPPSQPGLHSGFVTRAGTQFSLLGQPFRFVGANMYNAAGDPAVYQCGPWMSQPESELDQWFARARADFGGRVVRFWAYQRYTNGGTDWRGLDRVMRLANKHDLKVLPVLENHWAECTFGGIRDASWYGGGYQQPDSGYALSYQEYVRRVVTRYRDERAIFGWSLMNEAEGKTAGGADAAEALYTFARDMSALVKSLDSNHMVTLGVIGGGQPGVHGANFERLHGLPTIDFSEYHDYGANDEVLPGAPVTLTAPVQTAIYQQDSAWAWAQRDYVTNQARTWQTVTWTLPAGAAQPLNRIGIIVGGTYTGAAYLDEIQVGGRRFDFEDGTTQGWQIQSSTATIAPSTEQRVAGSRSLRIAFTQPTGETLLWVPALPSDGPGTTVSITMLVDTPGTPLPYNTMAVAMHKSREWLNKPLLIGEAGMTACGSWSGSQQESGASRATKLDAKMRAYFANGGSGYLIWAWEPDNSCNYAFGPGDPLNGVLKQLAATLTP